MNLAELSHFLREFHSALIGRTLSTEPIDTAHVESEMRSVYRLMGRRPPLFVWLEDPWQLADSPDQFQGGCGKCIRLSVGEDSVARRIRRITEESLGVESFNQYFQALWDTLPHQLSALIRLINVERNFSESWGWSSGWQRTGAGLESTPSLRIQQLEQSQMNLRFRVFSWMHFPRDTTAPRWTDAIEWSWNSLLRLAIAEVARKHFEIKLDIGEQSELDCLLSLANSCHAYLCFENVCFLSERPRHLCLDAEHRFHNSKGPAIAYGDQLKIYAWQGVRMPAYAIMEEPTVELIERERNIEVRRVLIERYGVHNYLLDSGSEIVHHDQYGTLYFKAMSNDEPIVMVHVCNSTPEPDGEYRTYFLRVPPHMRTAREAVAWTFGMEDSDYNPRVES